VAIATKNGAICSWVGYHPKTHIYYIFEWARKGRARRRKGGKKRYEQKAIRNEKIDYSPALKKQHKTVWFIKGKGKHIGKVRA